MEYVEATLYISLACQALGVGEPNMAMYIRLNRLMFLAALLWAAPVLAEGPVRPPCLMQPAHLTMYLPARGLAWLPGEELSGRCDDRPLNGWIRGTSGAVDLFVHADGPAGSGRRWDVTVGVGSKQRSKPVRGVCLTTSTVGWRTLQSYRKGVLPWLDDLDGDGRAELIVWESFPLHDDSSPAEYALVAWAYRLVSQDSLAIDWNLSRRLARSIAKEYRSPPGTAIPHLDKLRSEAAEALEGFADERCDALSAEAR